MISDFAITVRTFATIGCCCDAYTIFGEAHLRMNTFASKFNLSPCHIKPLCVCVCVCVCVHVYVVYEDISLYNDMGMT